MRIVRSCSWDDGVSCVLFAVLAACGIPRVELVPPAIARKTIEAKVVATTWGQGTPDEWFDAYEVDLTNPTPAPIDVAFPDFRLEAVSSLDGTKYAFPPRSAGVGGLSAGRRTSHEMPAFVRIEPNDTAKVWVAFGGAYDPRLAHTRTQLLAVPGADEVVIDTETPDHPDGVRQYFGRRRAAGLAFRSYVDVAGDHLAVPIPFVTGVSFLLCRLQFDGHAGYQAYYDAANGHYDRSSGFVGGAAATWHFSRYFALYGDLDYERRSGSNAASVGAGLGVMLRHDRDDQRAFAGFHRPAEQFRVGWVETVMGSDRWAAIRFGFEIDALSYF
jgi:hypothetical protein